MSSPKAAVPPVGYEVLSRSTSEYIARGSRVLVSSNWIRTSVGPYYRIRLTPVGSVAQPAFSLEGLEGDSLYCRFELRNVGNVADSVEVTSRLVRPSTIPLADVCFFHDANGNLELDPGEDDRAFLNLAPDETVDLSTLMVLSSGRGGGQSYLGVQATVGDDSVAYAEESVLRVVTRAAPLATLHLGPAGNPKALPGGEGGPEDVSRASAGYTTGTVVFDNDVLNESRFVDNVQIEPADSSGWPPGVKVVLEDTTGSQLQSSSSNPYAVNLGDLQTGQTRRIRVRVSTEAESFYNLTDDSLSIRLRVRSLLDTTRVNETTDRVVLAEPFNPAAAISLEQTFKQNQAGLGDVVALVVTITNVTDSVRVDDVVVRELPQPSLDFLASAGFGSDGTGIVWSVGSLGPGERRETVVKFTVNGRVSRGWARVTGRGEGSALGRGVSAGPVVNLLKIENDVFADEGIVLGDVFVDDNRNGARDEGEKGIARVGVFLESGEYALTDSTGRFSIPRVFSGYRVVRVDEATLPVELVDKGSVPTRTNAVFGTERLVHLLPSGHAVVSFPLPPANRATERVTRQISCGETVSIRKRRHALYQWPTIPSSFFESGKAYLKTGALGQLDPIVDFLGTHPGWVVLLEGHTDNVPIHNSAFSSNRELSIARAQAVMRYLSAKGVAEERLVVLGYGDARPIATNSTREGRAKNRRVCVTLVPPGTGIDDEAELGRLEADVQGIQAVTDSFMVHIVWELSTDAPDPFEMGLAVDLPREFDKTSIRVACGGEDVLADDGRYRIHGFAKSRGIECNIGFTCTEADTHLVRDVRAIVEPDVSARVLPPDASSGDGASSSDGKISGARNRSGDGTSSGTGKTSGVGALPPGRGWYNPSASEATHSIVLAPSVGDATRGGSRYFPLLTWDEEKNGAARRARSSARPAGASGATRADDAGLKATPAGSSDPQSDWMSTTAGVPHPEGSSTTAGVPYPEGSSTTADEETNLRGNDSSATKALGLIQPLDRSVVTKRDRVEVVIRVPLGSRYDLSANGAAVSEKQIGKKEIHLGERFEEITYYGIEIESGWNVIRLDAKPVDGSASLVDSVTVALAGRPTSMVVSPERVVLPADGRSSAQIHVDLRDQLGLCTINGLVATVVEGDTLLTDPDENPDQTGLQIASGDDGFILNVKPSAVTGRRPISIECHGLTASAMVIYVPPERRMFLAGIIEGRLGAYDTSGDGDPLGIEDYGQGFRAGGESRFFVQGTTFAGINLTARVDTKKRYDDPLLKTDNPETQYTMYGDASELHYAAPAQSGNYVAVEKGQSYLRYGDFRSPLSQGEFLVYKTNATGVEAALASGASGINAFVTKTDFVTVRDEIPGEGTSGYYYLSRAPVVENSVDLVVEVRDRYQPEKKIESRPLVEHRDFTVNYFNGAVLFKEPVPAFSQEMNPVTIVAIYESQTSEEGDYLYGIRGSLAEKRGFRLGSSALIKNGRDSDYAVYGADGGVSFRGWDLSGEFARSDDDIVGQGNAYKLQLGTKGLRGEHSVYLRKVDGDFLNPSFTGSAHELFSTKAGFDSRLELARGLSLESHGYRQRYANTGDERDDIDVFGKYDGPVFMLGGGLRAARQDRDGEERDGLLSMIGVGMRAGSRAELQSHWEMNHGKTTVDDYPDRLRSSLSVTFLEKYRFLATHEYLSAHDRPATHQLLTGVEAKAGRNSTVYSKYSMSRTANDERLGTILGLKQAVPISPDLTGTVDIEGFRSFSNRSEDEYVALKTGLSRLEKGRSLLEGRYEYQWQRAADHHLLRINAVRELDDGLAVLFKDALSVSSYDGRRSSLTMEGRIAGVYRPVVSPVQTLVLLKTQYDKYSPVEPDAIVWTTVFSTDVNYTPRPAHELRLKLAFKRVEDYSFGVSETGRNYLVLSQYVYRFARNWDVDVWGRFLGNTGAGTRQTGVGLEIGRVLFDRIRIGAGYSVNGLEERDLAEREAWQKGFGLRVQLILSDWMFSGYKF